MISKTRRMAVWIVMAGLALFGAREALAQSGSRNSSTNRNTRSSSSTYRSSYGNSSGQAADGSKMTGTAVIQYDAGTGTVIVFTDEETNKHIQKIIDSLDRPVPQVLIKVLFLEVTHTKNLDLGVQGQIKSVHGDKSQEVSTIFGLARETQGGFYKIIDDDLELTIRAIAEDNKLEVLSRPSVLTRNNQAATIMVGQEIPFITNSQVTDSGNTISDYEYRDIGIILNVTPHIAPERMVEMQVTPEISTLTADTVQIQEDFAARIISKRAADTRVLVGDGKTVVIGGMMGNTNTDEVTKVPLLGDIPYVGALFRRTIKAKSKTELLIFLTPIVVDNPEEVRQVSRNEREGGTLAPKVYSNKELREYLSKPAGSGPDGVLDEPAGETNAKEAGPQIPASGNNSKIKTPMKRTRINQEELRRMLTEPGSTLEKKD